MTQFLLAKGGRAGKGEAHGGASVRAAQHVRKPTAQGGGGGKGGGERARDKGTNLFKTNTTTTTDKTKHQ